MKETRVKVNQLELQIREYGLPAGEAIIFLHFSGANLMMWQRIVPYFQERYRLILVDLRGHGKSDRPESGYHIDEMADDILGVMQYLDIAQEHIVGSSLGAEVGLSLAANHPEKVRSLVCDGALSSEFGPYSAWEGTEAEFEVHAAEEIEKMRKAEELRFPSMDAAIARARGILEPHGYWNEYFEALERYGVYQAAEGEYRKSFQRRFLADYLQYYFHYRFEEYYQRVKCPLLMLPGENVLENEREKAALQGLKELAAQGQIVAIPGWDHPYGWMLTPEEVSKVVLEFLDGVSHG
jgi:2-succinyl-6-hydroxy-2,4-cyclohexadiene-1-carboxylate synthase